METVWKITSHTFTGSFLAMMLGSAVMELLSLGTGDAIWRALIWIWFGAAAATFFVGWFAVIWRPLPGKAWNAFVFVVAHVVFVGGGFIWIAGRG